MSRCMYGTSLAKRAKNVPAVMEAGRREGIAVLPAMEVETEEGVHILTLYPTLSAAEAVASAVYAALPDIENRPEIFGRQLIMDCDDNITGIEEKLLISPTSLSINTLFKLVSDAHGIFIPAHVDRHSFSILTALGFMPEDLDIKMIEISRNTTDVSAYLESRPELKKYKILRNSDAHYLEHISEKTASLDIENAFDIFEWGADL